MNSPEFENKLMLRDSTVLVAAIGMNNSHNTYIFDSAWWRGVKVASNWKAIKIAFDGVQVFSESVR